MWANSGRWRRTGVLQSMGSQRVTQNLETERRWQGKNNVWGRKAYFTNEECSVLLYHPTLINHKLSSTISSVSGTLPGNGNTCSQRTVKLRIQNIFMKRQTTYITGLSVSQFSHSVMSDSLRPHGLQHTRPPCPSPIPRTCSNSCPSSRWCHPTISSSVVPFFSCLQSFPASGSFPMSHLFTSHGQSIGASASASILPMKI